MLKLDLLCLFIEMLMLKISRNILSPDSTVITSLCNSIRKTLQHSCTQGENSCFQSILTHIW